MTVTFNFNTKYRNEQAAADYVAPVNLTASTPSNVNVSVFGGDIQAFEQTSAATGLWGGRITFTSTDFSDENHIYFTGGYNTFGTIGRLDTHANGGVQLLFEDSVGNYSIFYVHGSDIPDFADSTANGFFGSFDNDLRFILERAKTPNVTSGTLDWTDVVAIEIYVKVTTSGNVGMGLAEFSTIAPTVVTGTETMASIYADYSNTSNAPFSGGQSIEPLFMEALPKFASASQKTYNVKWDIDFGDGSTTTNVTDSNFAFGIDTTLADKASYFFLGEFLHRTDPVTIRVNQAAADTVSLTDFSIARSSLWDFTVLGNSSGAATFTRGSFFRAQDITCAHGTFANCAFDGITNKIELNANSVLTSGVFRNLPNTSQGLRYTGIAADKSAITADFESSNAGIDLTVGSGGAGTYNFSGLTVSGGHTLNVWNESTTNAATVKITSGVSVQPIDLWFNYDNEASGPFTLGETLTFGNGATATLVNLIDNGTTGTMYCELLTGTAPPDNNSISGGTSSATADVNEASGASNSSLTIDNAVTVTVRVTTIDTAGSPIQNARVYIEAGATGPLTQGTVILNGLSDASGIVDDTSFTYTADQSIQNAKVRKGTTTPIYKTSSIAGTITSAGFDVTVVMVLDE